MSLLRVEHVTKTFARAGSTVRAVTDVSFTLEEGETLGLIGESGSGKSTLGRLVLGLLSPDSGRIWFGDRDLASLTPRQLRAARSEFSVVFQEPLESLNPRMTVEALVAEPLHVFRRDLSRGQRRARVVQSLEEVGLDGSYLGRRPTDLSGGQQQRVGIARALIVEPRMIVLDEPTSSLDLTVRATILNLLRDLQLRHRLTYLFISHDLATVHFFCDRTAVMYLGQFMETAPTPALLASPRHPYSRALLSSTLSADPTVSTATYPLAGDIRSQPADFRGCPLVGRCPLELPACSTTPVELRPVGPGRSSNCIRAGELHEVFEAQSALAGGKA